VESTGEFTVVADSANAERGTHFYRPESFVGLIDWANVFAKNRPIEIDVGCGKGSFLVWAAHNNPMANFLGVDRQLDRLRKVEKKLNRLSLSNVMLIRIEASYLVGKLIRDETVTAYHSYFSDPWPKRRHHNRRLFSKDYVANLNRTLTVGGALHLATDHEDYFHAISRLVSELPTFVKSDRAPLPAEAQTEFERDFIAENKPIYRQSWRKT